MSIADNYNYVVYSSGEDDIKGKEAPVVGHCTDRLDEAREIAEQKKNSALVLNAVIVETHRRFVEVVKGCIGMEMLKRLNQDHKKWTLVQTIHPPSCSTRMRIKW